MIDQGLLDYAIRKMKEDADKEVTTSEEYIPNDVPEEFDFLQPELLEKYRNKPVGFWLKQQLRENKRQEPRTGCYDTYMREKNQIIDPMLYVGSEPDIRVRYTTP